MKWWTSVIVRETMDRKVQWSQRVNGLVQKEKESYRFHTIMPYVIEIEQVLVLCIEKRNDFSGC